MSEKTTTSSICETTIDGAAQAIACAFAFGVDAALADDISLVEGEVVLDLEDDLAHVSEGALALLRATYAAMADVDNLTHGGAFTTHWEFGEIDLCEGCTVEVGGGVTEGNTERVYHDEPVPEREADEELRDAINHLIAAHDLLFGED